MSIDVFSSTTTTSSWVAMYDGDDFPAEEFEQIRPIDTQKSGGFHHTDCFCHSGQSVCSHNSRQNKICSKSFAWSDDDPHGRRHLHQGVWWLQEKLKPLLMETTQALET